MTNERIILKMEWRALIIVINFVWFFTVCVLALCYGIWRGKNRQPSEKEINFRDNHLFDLAWLWGWVFVILSASSIAWHMKDDDEPFLHSLFHQTVNEMFLLEPSLDLWIKDCDNLNQNNYDICTDLIESCEARRTCIKERK